MQIHTPCVVLARGRPEGSPPRCPGVTAVDPDGRRRHPHLRRRRPAAAAHNRRPHILLSSSSPPPPPSLAPLRLTTTMVVSSRQSAFPRLPVLASAPGAAMASSSVDPGRGGPALTQRRCVPRPWFRPPPPQIRRLVRRQADVGLRAGRCCPDSGACSGRRGVFRAQIQRVWQRIRRMMRRRAKVGPVATSLPAAAALGTHRQASDLAPACSHCGLLRRQHDQQPTGRADAHGRGLVSRLPARAGFRFRPRRRSLAAVIGSSPSCGRRVVVWRSLVVLVPCLVVGGVVVGLAQVAPFQGCRCPLRFRGLAKASACLRADDSDVCERRPPLEASFLCLLLSPHWLIFRGHLGPLGRLVLAVVPDSRLSSLRRRQVWWCRSYSPLRRLSATCGSMLSHVSLR
jgi:hypothetical protein